MTPISTERFSLRREVSKTTGEEPHETANQFDQKVKRLREQEIKRLRGEIHKLQEDKEDLLCLVGYIRRWVTAPDQESAQQIFNSTLRKMQKRHGNEYFR
jgi:hypothetical protein